MTADLPPLTADAIGRVEGSDGTRAVPPADVTGALGDLWTWWHSLVPGASVEPRWLDGPDGPIAAAMDAGVTAADAAVDAGVTLLIPRVARPDDTVARTVIGLLTRKESSAVLAQPAGMTDRDWMVACADIRDRMADVVEHRGEPVPLLDHLGAGSLAGVVGILLGAAARRTPCLVDGTPELAAALVADRLAFRAKGWWRAGATSPDPARIAAVDRIDLTPGLPLDLSDDAGRGAEVTVDLLELLLSRA